MTERILTIIFFTTAFLTTALFIFAVIIGSLVYIEVLPQGFWGFEVK